VESPDGRTWRVARVWLSRRPRWRGRDLPKSLNLDNAGDLAEGCVDLEAFLFAVIAIVVAVLLWYTVLPALLLGFEVLVTLLFAAGAVLGHEVLRRPWKVTATTEGPPPERVEIPVVGWRASGAHVQQVAWRIAETGDPLPR